jgi:hypothetical protein
LGTEWGGEDGVGVSWFAFEMGEKGMGLIEFRMQLAASALLAGEGVVWVGQLTFEFVFGCFLSLKGVSVFWVFLCLGARTYTHVALLLCCSVSILIFTFPLPRLVWPA